MFPARVREVPCYSAEGPCIVRVVTIPIWINLYGWICVGTLGYEHRRELEDLFQYLQPSEMVGSLVFSKVTGMSYSGMLADIVEVLGRKKCEIELSPECAVMLASRA